MMHCRYPRVNFCARALKPRRKSYQFIARAASIRDSVYIPMYPCAQPSRRIINCRPDRNCCFKRAPASSRLSALYNRLYRRSWPPRRCRWACFKNAVTRICSARYNSCESSSVFCSATFSTSLQVVRDSDIKFAACTCATIVLKYRVSRKRTFSKFSERT